ncbi:MAG: class I SAM-dependent methyltransferase [Rhodocyclaceae bacterium]|nr:class I SAM-dependent methyltransferase [Rhodocyclaceae bacterium]
MRDIARHGQVFTPPAIVEAMLRLRRNAGRVLEPACGDGAFSKRLPGCVAIELDAAHCPAEALNVDFFAYPESEQFDTIVGNPPYVKARDIQPGTRQRLHSRLLNGHSNLYLHFIEKCVRHLKPGGELIFITPRDFLKATGAARLNTWLFDQGTITDFEELGDARVFDGVVPNCAIWRFEKGSRARRLADGRRMVLSGGQILLTRGVYSVPLSGVFAVKVGGVSGADQIFTHAELGNADFVCSKTAQTGELRRMIWLEREGPIAYLEPFKERLLARRVTKFDESNWWKWGRRHFVSDAPRLYVNQKTRQPRPFFLDDCRNYDGAILALFPHRRDADLALLRDMLNAVDWAELGFVCDGRFLFAQRSLEQALLPEDFAPFAVRQLV